MLNRFKNVMQDDTADYKPLNLSIPDEDEYLKRYELYESFYESNSVYDEIMRYANLNGQWIETLQPLLNPTFQSVEFFASRLIIKPVVLSTSEAIVEAVNQFWTWSNFAQNRDAYSRNLSKLGDLFIKIKNDENKVFMEEVEAKYVTKVVVDTRNVVQEIRIDIPIENNEWYVEYWTKESGGYVSVWKHSLGKDVELERLGTPKYSATLAEFGITFIPIVYIKFTNQKYRAKSCFSHALKKIIDGDRKLSRFNEILFSYNAPYWNVLTSSTDKSGYVQARSPEIKIFSNGGMAKYQYVKNGFSLESAIPNIDYQASLNSLEFTKKVLEESLPELRAGSIETTQLSGRAITNLLGESVSRAKTARSNLVQGLLRIDEMALTIGKNFGIFPATVGEYDEFNFKHEIRNDAIIALDMSDKTLILQQATSSGVPLKSALRMAEFSDEEIQLIMSEKAQETIELANSFLNNSNFGNDVNNNAV